MSALEIIEQIKALPLEEQAAVVRFVHQLEAGGASPRAFNSPHPEKPKPPVIK